MNALDEIFTRIWQVSLSAAVLIALGGLVLLCFSKSLPAWARYGIWLLVFLRLLLPVTPPASFSLWNLSKPQATPPSLPSPSSLPSLTTHASQPHPEHQPAPVLPLIWFLGALAWLALAIARHQQLARWLRRQSPCTDPRVLALLDRARAAFRLRPQVAVLCVNHFEAPAVFGVWRPRLLLPATWLTQANDEELYAVLLHEMAHVKCRDALLNWICIFARSLHWFNPLVWYAFRRLRCERELFCDALVLKRLRPPQRTAYGATLIQMAARLSPAPAPPTLVPMLQHKPEIHRRIHMIAKYKRTPWLVSAAFALLLIALAGLTFTRAAEKPPPQKPPAAQEQPKPLDALRQEIAKQQEFVRNLQAKVNALRGDLTAGEALDRHSETLRALEGRRIETRAELQRLSSLHKVLSQQSKQDLRRSISTAAPDQQLTQLMSSRDVAEQKLAEMSEYAPEHPEVKRMKKLIEKIDQQIDDRIAGILGGMKVRIEAEQEQHDALELAIAQAKKDYREGLHRGRPYQEALQELRRQEDTLERLRARLIQEQVDRAIEPPTKD